MDSNLNSDKLDSQPITNPTIVSPNVSSTTNADAPSIPPSGDTPNAAPKTDTPPSETPMAPDTSSINEPPESSPNETQNKLTPAETPIAEVPTVPSPALEAPVSPTTKSDVAKNIVSDESQQAQSVQDTPTQPSEPTSPTPEVDTSSTVAPEASAPVVVSAPPTPDMPQSTSFNFANITPKTTSSAANPAANLLDRIPLKLVGIAFAGLVVLTATSIISFAAGAHAAKPMLPTSNTTAAAFTLPAGATIIEQCSPGLGTQYVLPKDIPGGPVYNVYQGKLIGIEYMEDLATIEKMDTVLNNLPLFGQKYDHVNIMPMAAHAGMPMPHYQIDIMMVPAATAAKITCSSSTSSTSNMNMSSTTNTANSKM